MPKTLNMTSGSISRQLIGYALPLILGNIFQLTYNVVDAAIVGRFIGKDVLAAVGTASPVMNLFILGISGVCIGASVIMSRAFGADDFQKLRREMATLSVFGLYFSAIITLPGIIFAGQIMTALQVPNSIYDVSVLYLRLIFIGMPFTYFYNAISSALKSVGDSKTPLKFLVFASVLNAGLDIVLIGFFGFGVVCSAMTTVVAQAVSAVLCIIYVYRKVPVLHIEAHGFKADRALLKETLKYGGVTALQQACQPIGKLLIQGCVNTMGVDVMAAFNAATRVDDYACTPEQNISHAMTTFTAQNYGANKPERIRRGFRVGMLIELVYGVVIFGLVFLCRTPIMHIFVSADAVEVIRLGSDYLALMSFLYILPGFTNGFQGYFRGMGHMPITLAGTITQITIRTACVYALSQSYGINAIPAACATGWCVMLVLQVVYYFKMKK
ncbi:MAG: MATE family efflux transporter [Ruminococcaceae bacterium]|nr:MATE family efflux transporter [Oscillospiraceae bacterium]